MYPIITLRRHREESILRHHPWIFSGAIAQMPPDIVPGSVVRVCSSDGRFLAVGHYQPATIAVRVLSWDDRRIDDAFWRQRITAAWQMRKTLGLTDNAETNAFRLIHGEGDGLPGLVIDCYDHTAVMQAHSMGMHEARNTIAQALKEVCADNIHHIYYKSETTLSKTNHPAMLNGYLLNSEPTAPLSQSGGAVAMENGMRFHIDLERGQKTGFFLDQRDNRSLVGHYAKGKTVLNLFCYTGGFSCYALRGGATRVDSVDSSERAIQLVNENVMLNFGDQRRHKAICADAFQFLDTTEEMYDIVILDPPAFAKHRQSLHNALQGYTRLNKLGMERVVPGGLLFTFSCSQAISKEHFRGAVLNAALQAGRKAHIVCQLQQGMDHPINVCHPEGEYLKGLVLYVE